ncbi:hypothetical protein AB0E69_07300 [Kribbella sp. NPDC026611]|uniref:hypothetical protein n=1 Tax=Kribbella sp. NPDC026611 TaxID=3154911 RepID=UPI0033C30192
MKPAEVKPADQPRATGEPARPATDRKVDAPQAASPARPEPDHFKPADKPAEAAKDARHLLELSEGKNPVVVVDKSSGIRQQLEKMAAGAEPGKAAAELTGKGHTLEIGADQAKALSVLRVLADKTAERRNDPEHQADVLQLVSYVRFGEGTHGEGVAFDIGKYGGHSFDQNNPAESRAAVKALAADLPPGNYGLGLPRLPNKFPIPENAAHFAQYGKDAALFGPGGKDAASHPPEYVRLPAGQFVEGADPKAPGYQAVYAKASEHLLRAEDPHFRQPETAKEIKPFGDLSRLDPGTTAVIREAATRQIFLTPFPDGFNHAHLSVVGPGAKHF